MTLLRKLREVKPEGNSICYQLRLSVKEAEKLVELFKRWPQFSGWTAYPVPHEWMRPIAAFYNLPLWEDAYGEMRKDLLAFCIEELENETRN